MAAVFFSGCGARSKFEMCFMRREASNFSVFEVLLRQAWNLFPGRDGNAESTAIQIVGPIILSLNFEQLKRQFLKPFRLWSLQKGKNLFFQVHSPMIFTRTRLRRFPSNS